MARIVGPSFRLLDEWPAQRLALVLDNNDRRVFVMGADGETVDSLPSFAAHWPVAARFDGRPDRVVVHTEDSHESAGLYSVRRDGAQGPWRPPQLLALPPGCVPLSFGDGGQDGVVALHYSGANGTDLCRYDGNTGRLRVLHRDSGWIYGAVPSPDRRFVAFLVAGPASLSATLWLAEVDGTGPARLLHPPSSHAALGLPAWTGDGRLVFCSTHAREFAAVLMLDPMTGDCRELVAGQHDLDVRVLTGDDRLLIIENRDGVSKLSLMHPAQTGPGTPLRLPEPGLATVHRRPAIGPGDELLVTFSAPGRPAGLWAVRPDRGARPCTPPAQPNLAARPQRFHVTAADRVDVPVLDWFPARAAKPGPVVVALHGGPEDQWRHRHEPLFDRLHGLGVAVLAADLRGSLGFGMSFSRLDDGVRNFDVLLDLAAVHACLDGRGLDARRAVLLGTSFGAYQVLLALAHQPHLWSAGVAVSGVSDPLTYLRQTQPHRRAQRELAYGSPQRDGARLAQMSPLAAAAKIVSPLLLAHGVRDVRVPAAQSREMARAVREAGGDVVLREFEEGHRFAEPANIAALHELITEFVHLHTYEKQ